MIEEAPKIAEAQEKKRREQLAAANARRPRYNTDVPVLQDKRFELQVTTAAAMRPLRSSRKALKAERRAKQLTFLTLFFVLVIALAWLWKLRQ
jgi:hypothetical protein